MKSCLCRVVKADLKQNDDLQGFVDLVPEHPRDLLQWATALQVQAQLSAQLSAPAPALDGDTPRHCHGSVNGGCNQSSHC